jgi:hypothetical protein
MTALARDSKLLLVSLCVTQLTCRIEIYVLYSFQTSYFSKSFDQLLPAGCVSFGCLLLPVVNTKGAQSQHVERL